MQKPGNGSILVNTDQKLLISWVTEDVTMFDAQSGFFFTWYTQHCAHCAIFLENALFPTVPWCFMPEPQVRGRKDWWNSCLSGLFMRLSLPGCWSHALQSKFSSGSHPSRRNDAPQLTHRGAKPITRNSSNVVDIMAGHNMWRRNTSKCIKRFTIQRQLPVERLGCCVKGCGSMILCPKIPAWSSQRNLGMLAFAHIFLSPDSGWCCWKYWSLETI